MVEDEYIQAIVTIKVNLENQRPDATSEEIIYNLVEDLQMDYEAEDIEFELVEILDFPYA